MPILSLMRPWFSNPHKLQIQNNPKLIIQNSRPMPLRKYCQKYHYLGPSPIIHRVSPKLCDPHLREWNHHDPDLLVFGEETTLFENLTVY